MILAAGVLIPLFLVSVWIFFSSSPRATTSTRVALYNVATLAVAVICSGVYATWLYADMSVGADFRWWPVSRLLGHW